MVGEKIDKILTAEKQAEQIIARAKEEGQKLIKKAESDAVRIVEKALQEADEEIAKLKQKSDELHKADIEEIRSKTKEELAAVDLRVKQNFEAAAELVLSRLV